MGKYLLWSIYTVMICFMYYHVGKQYCNICFMYYHIDFFFEGSIKTGYTMIQFISIILVADGMDGHQVILSAMLEHGGYQSGGYGSFHHVH